MARLQFPQIQQADFIGAMQAAQQYRANEQAMRAKQEELLFQQQQRARLPRLQELQGRALQGDEMAIRELQTFDPTTAMDVSNYRLSQEKLRSTIGKTEADTARTQGAARTEELKGDELDRQEKLRRVDRLAGLFTTAQQKPAMLPTILGIMKAEGMEPKGIETNLSAEGIPNILTHLQIQRDMLENNTRPEKVEEFKTFLAEKERAIGRELTPDETIKAWDDMQAKSYAPGKGGGDIFNIGGESQAATKGLQTELQGDVNEGVRMLSMLQRLDNTFDESFVTGFGNIRREVGAFLNKWTGISVDSEFRQAARQWVSERNQFFNTYRKLITGAGAAMGELKSLEDSILSPSTPPDEVKASIRQLAHKTERNTKIAMDILANGVPTTRAEFDRRLDAAINAADAGEKQSTGDSALLSKRQEINQQHQKLMDSGMNQQQADAEIRKRYSNGP